MNVKRSVLEPMYLPFILFNKKFFFQFWLLPSVLNCDYVGVPVQCYDGRSDDYPVCIESIYT